MNLDLKLKYPELQSKASSQLETVTSFLSSGDFFVLIIVEQSLSFPLLISFPYLHNLNLYLSREQDSGKQTKDNI